ncbi:phosphoribosylformimino-5-aminoimidazole carboxamide ribotide isomerase [Marinomonas fungiae]|uniref:1-(5-phosphoribosyl)-5-[(5-phosphoribosylamino)methylideneamino] imidazole-4-carboxamide isomerase n=1 Tax=Marinomonas fungiae TaxID=1137284 RepID=A0A0K6IMN2_9GAMM|nr:phosphoribosylformimino-5-aminoimidazole carboxamide ribotide isomerase [Marinomonas fungiae]CUB04351.1 1-(5-phosphoribosyl)-5-[(5-phosphoribosylamino)methylideneamino] imidazole-4-carboxamide isomerase [Marinomonas fungiae]
MTLFRPCIDLHQGKVKQIVGGSLNDTGAKENFISDYDAAYYANLYREHGLTGGHVIALGKDHENKLEALSALRAYPNGLQYGGGVTVKNAAEFLKAGASHVIVTSYLFENGEFSWDRLDQIKRETGTERLVLDLSCRRVDDSWFIATDRWQTITSTEVNLDNLIELANHCDEFLIHAADVEGLQAGIDERLVTLLGQGCPIDVTYAGGARSLADLKRVHELSNGQVDLTIGSALDIFGGKGVILEDCINWNHQQ